jgi:hypothetical protein
VLASTLLASCASTPSVDGRPVVELASPAAKPSARLIQTCAGPTQIRPDMAGAGLSAGQAERLWATDRDALKACRDRHAALVRFIRDRDAALAGGRTE